jgi:hypothetical protein
MELISCTECKTESTSKWYYKRFRLRTLCKKCYDRIRHSAVDPLRITYKGRRIHLKFLPRKKKCSECGRRGKTHIHHDKYDDNNPLSNVRELCASCHAKVGWKMGIYDNKSYEYRDPKTGRFIRKV